MNNSDNISLLTHDAATRLEFDWGELTWFASRELGNSTALTLGQCVLNPRQGNPRHYHPNCVETLVVISGKILHTGPEGEPIEMNPGDTITIPAKAWHQATNIGDEKAVLFIAFDSADRETVGE